MKAFKFTFCSLILISIICITSCTDQTQRNAGWDYVCTRLKSPSTAKLIGYAAPDAPPCVEFANKIGLDGLSVAMYEVDSQNGFGAMVRDEFLVFFKNGVPMHMEVADDVIGMNPSNIKSLLKYSGY